MFLNKLIKRIRPWVGRYYRLSRGVILLSKLHLESFNRGELEIEKVLRNASCFLESMSSEKEGYRYSADSVSASIYGTVYAFLTKSMLGELDTLTEDEKDEWAQFFDSFQSKDDGLFYDSSLNSKTFVQSDWWGARHLAVHMIAAYSCINRTPRHRFHFLKDYHNTDYIEQWLDAYDWTSNEIGNTDLDNKIMNITCLLQYERDTYEDSKSKISVDFIKDYLLRKINPELGIWGEEPSNKVELSRMVQYAYHLLTIFVYDEDFRFDRAKIVDLALATQNSLGGFGVAPNSSACEDMDSAYILVNLSSGLDEPMQEKVSLALTKFYDWVFLNQAKDGGFVFRREEAFWYGSDNTFSGKNKGAMLPTWFRILSILIVAKKLGYDTVLNYTKCPGY